MSAFYDYLSENPRILTILIAIITLLTLVLTLIPSDMMSSTKLFTYDKIGHFIIFGTWTYLLGLHQYITMNKQLNLLTLFFIGVSFGLTIELLQYLLPLNRNADFFDLAFDSLGCFAAIAVLVKTVPPE